MKRVFVFAFALLLAAWLIGMQFQIAGADRASLAARVALPAGLWPLAMPLFGLAVLGLITAFRFKRIYPHLDASEITKENRLLIAGVLFGPSLALLMQIYFGLEYFSLVDKEAMMRGLAVFQSIAFMAIGNYLAIQDPKNGPLFRTPWTVRSQTVCAVVHRFLGNGIVTISVIALGAAAFAPGKLVIFAHIASLLTLKAAAFVYSMTLWRRLDAQGAPITQGPLDGR